MKKAPHRKLVTHYDKPNDVHELAFSCYRRRPLLLDDERRRVLGRSIHAGLQRHSYLLLAFAFMPEHVHLLVLPTSTECRVSRLLYAIKKPASERIKRLLASDPLLDELTIPERPGKTVFRFWQEGPGYDRNLESSEAVRAAIDYIHMNPVKRGLCTDRSDWIWSSCRQFRTPNAPIPDGIPEVARLSF